MSPPPSGKPLPFYQMFVSSAIAACTAEVRWFGSVGLLALLLQRL